MGENLIVPDYDFKTSQLLKAQTLDAAQVTANKVLENTRYALGLGAAVWRVPAFGQSTLVDSRQKEKTPRSNMPLYAGCFRV